jgi:hypothetical protein
MNWLAVHAEMAVRTSLLTIASEKEFIEVTKAALSVIERKYPKPKKEARDEKEIKKAR